MYHPLIFSIFYNQKEWHKAVKYFDSLSTVHHFEDISIKLSYMRGPHLMVTLIVKEGDKFSLSEKISTKLEQFLVENPSSENGIKSYSDLIYKDFPNNNIHYGIRIHGFQSQTINSRNLHNEMARVVIELFNHYNSQTIDNLTEIFLQKFVILCKVMDTNIHDLIRVFRGFFEASLVKSKEEERSALIQQSTEDFINNRKDLLEFFESVLLNPSWKAEEAWEKSWFSICMIIKNLEPKSKTDKYRYLIDMSSENLGFEFKSNALHMFVLSLENLDLTEGKVVVNYR